MQSTINYVGILESTKQRRLFQSNLLLCYYSLTDAKQGKMIRFIRVILPLLLLSLISCLLFVPLLALIWHLASAKFRVLCTKIKWLSMFYRLAKNIKLKKKRRGSSIATQIEPRFEKLERQNQAYFFTYFTSMGQGLHPKKWPRMIRNAKHSSSNHFSHSSPWKINAILREITFTAGKSSGYLSTAYARIYSSSQPCSVLEIIAAHKIRKRESQWSIRAVCVTMQWQNLGWCCGFFTVVAHIIDAFLRLVYHKRFSEPTTKPRFPSLYGELPKEKLQKLALKALRSHEIFKERRHKEPPHISNMLYTTYIAFFHFIACCYCQIMSRVTLHNFWPKIVKRKSYYVSIVCSVHSFFEIQIA